MATDNEPFILAVRFDLLPGHEDEFDKLVDETLRGIDDSEAGTFVYACHGILHKSGARVFYEFYRDKAAFDAHEQRDHTRRFLALRSQHLSREPRVEYLTDVRGKGIPTR